jgi:hypothetical protein
MAFKEIMMTGTGDDTDQQKRRSREERSMNLSFENI